MGEWVKKVSTTPLSPTSGEIVDSMSASVDTHTNAPSISAVNGVVGDTDISSIGDGTVTGAIGAVNNGLIKLNNLSMYEFEMKANTAYRLTHTGTVIIYTDRGGMWTTGASGRGLAEVSASSVIAVEQVDYTHLTITNNIRFGTIAMIIGSGDISATLA